MTDPFELLRERLVHVAARNQPATLPRRPRASRRIFRPSRPLAAFAASLVLAGSAAAGVFSLTSNPSQPVAGSVPGSRGPSVEPVSLAGDQYRIQVTPELTAGSVGWCTSLIYSYRGKSGFGSDGECGGQYPQSGSPAFAGNIDSTVFSLPAPQFGDTVRYLLVGPGLAYVRVGDRTITVRHDASLPAGDGIVVLVVPAASPPLAVPAPGQRLPLYLDLRTVGLTPSDFPHGVLPHDLPPWYPKRGQPMRVRETPAIPLDATGRPIAITASPSYGGASTRFWMRPQQVPAGDCKLDTSGLAGLTPQWGTIANAIVPATEVQGAAFLSCVSTEYYLHRWPITAAVLLNAQHPEQPVGPIPGLVPFAGVPGVYTLQDAGAWGALTARRVGKAWLVLNGGRDLAQRIAVLRALRVSSPRLGIERR